MFGHLGSCRSYSTDIGVVAACLPGSVNVTMRAYLSQTPNTVHLNTQSSCRSGHITAYTSGTLKEPLVFHLSLNTSLDSVIGSCSFLR